MLVAVPLLACAGGRLYRGGLLNTAGRLTIGQAWARAR